MLFIFLGSLWIWASCTFGFLCSNVALSWADVLSKNYLPRFELNLLLASCENSTSSFLSSEACSYDPCCLICTCAVIWDQVWEYWSNRWRMVGVWWTSFCISRNSEYRTHLRCHEIVCVDTSTSSVACLLSAVCSGCPSVRKVWMPNQILPELWR